MPKKIWKLKLNAPNQNYDAVTGLLYLAAPYGWEERTLPTGATIFSIYAEKREYLQEALEKTAHLADGLISQAEAPGDPLESWKEFFTPVSCGAHFVVLPPWLADQSQEGRLKIIIDPKSAFGTGHHPTTALCLTGLSKFLDKEKNTLHVEFLDLGCGSGVLGIGAALAGMSGIGLDIDQQAVANALENCQLNHIANLEIAQGSLERAKGRKFDLIMANILAQPLMEMAKDIQNHLKPDGKLILSGILARQADEVENAYRNIGMPQAERLKEEEWAALMWL